MYDRYRIVLKMLGSIESVREFQWPCSSKASHPCETNIVSPQWFGRISTSVLARESKDCLEIISVFNRRLELPLVGVRRWTHHI